jgi:hypothetical protein
MSRPLRRPVLAAAVTLLLVPATAGAAARDYAATALNIIPSGQSGAVPPPDGGDRQARMYDALTPRFDDVTSRDVTRTFKSARFGTAGQCPCRTERVPRRGVRIVRDRFGVPHITARRVDDLTWAAGWVVAEDRGALLEQARWNARVAAVDAPGLQAITLVAELRTFVPSPQTEAELAGQTRVLRAAGRKGRRVVHDIDRYVEGINAQLRATRSANRPWTRNDVYAVNALKGQFLGQGGGDEARRSMFLSGLQQRLGPQSGQLVFDDLRQRDPADHPITIAGRSRTPRCRIPRPATGSSTATAFARGSTAPPAARPRSAPRPRRAPRPPRRRPPRRMPATCSCSRRTAPRTATRSSSAGPRSATSTRASRSRWTSTPPESTCAARRAPARPATC